MAEAGRENDTRRRFLDQPSLDGALACLASRQHGVVTLDQLTGLGLSARAVQYRAARGCLHRVYRGVYSLVPPKLLAREGWWMAAVLSRS